MIYAARMYSIVLQYLQRLLHATPSALLGALLITGAAKRVQAAPHAPPLIATKDAQCTVQAPAMRRQELLRRNTVLGVSLSKDLRTAVLLLQGGHTVYVRHIGCAHVSFSLSTWIDVKPTDTTGQLQSARQLAAIGFLPLYAPTTAWQNTEFDGDTADILSHKTLDLQVQYLPLADGTYVLHLVYTPQQ